jgi:hypothetical protein
MRPANLAVDFHEVLLQGHMETHREAIRKRDVD